MSFYYAVGEDAWDGKLELEKTIAPFTFAFRDVVYERLVELCVDICRRNGKRRLLWIADKAAALAYEPKEDEMLLTVHRWFANKECPGD